MFDKIKVLTAHSNQEDKATYIISCALNLLDKMMKDYPNVIKKDYGTYLYDCAKEFKN